MDPRERQEVIDELVNQLAEGNGYETDATRGMTLRELVLEMRQDMKNRPERREVYSVIAVLVAIFSAWAGLA